MRLNAKYFIGVFSTSLINSITQEDSVYQMALTLVLLGI